MAGPAACPARSRFRGTSNYAGFRRVIGYQCGSIGIFERDLPRKPGDELKLTVEPLRSGAPGGAWTVSKTKFKDGRPIVVSH
jgi:hypothetical protein